jgi:hypothetical protein
MPTETAQPPTTSPFDLSDAVVDAPVAPQRPAAAAQPRTSAERPKQPEHAPYMVEMARDFFSDAEINGMSPAELVAQVRGAQRFVLTERNQRSATAALEPQRNQGGGSAATVPSGGAPTAAAPSPAAPVIPEDEFGIRALKDELDERFYNVLDKMAQKIKTLSRLEALEPEVKGLRQNEMSRQQRQVFDVIDGAFDLLGPEYEKTFGTGPAAEMVNTPELKRRRALMQLANIDFSKNPNSRKIAEVLKPLAAELFGTSATFADVKPPATDPYGLGRNGQQPAATPAKPTERPRGPDGRFLPPTPEEWEEAQTQRPTERNGSPEVKGEKKAMKTAAQWLKDRGFDEEGNKALDGFL